MPDMMQQSGVVVQKPRSDVYTTMLILSFIAIVTGIILLVLEWKRYDFDIKASRGKLQTSIELPMDVISGQGRLA
ncbi:MAG: hypothetical protein AB7O62_21575 [Pirellulales bacterium]